MVGRWHGVDAARGLAIVGMIVAHTWPRAGSDDELLVDGRPSVLFVVVAGIALGLVSGRAADAGAPDPGAADPGAAAEARRQERVRLVVRAVILFLVGVLLWMLPSGIAIILDYYGVLFVLAVPLLFASRWVLGIISSGLLIAAPLARDAIVAARLAPGEPVETLLDYLFTGFYPALLWLPLLGFGLLATRSGLDRARTRVVMVLGGMTASIGGYGAAAVIPGVSAQDHSGTIAELLGSGGLAFAVVGTLLLLLDPTGSESRVARAILAPLTQLGRVALTVYVGHVLIIVMVAEAASVGPAGLFESPLGEVLAITLVLAGVLTGLACAAVSRRGPLEALLSGAARLVSGRATVAPAVPSAATRVED